MGALVKSVENFTTTFNPSGTGQHNNVVNLTLGQDETNCFAFATLRHTNGSQSDNRSSNSVGVEFFDNAGTPAARVYWSTGSDSSPGDLLADIFVVEGGSALTVEQDTITLTGTSATATVSAVTQTKACVVFTKVAIGATTGDDFNDFMVQASFNSDTQIAMERRASGTPDWTIYAYTLSSDDWDTEYVEDSWTTNEQGPTNLTLSNSVTLANAFIVATYETSEGADDLRDGIVNHALTGTTTLTWYRNHGVTPSATGTIGVWVVRATSAEFATQRFATDVDGQLTTNQTITTVDLDKAVVIGSGNVGGHGWAIDSTTTGSNTMDRQHTTRLTSTTNAQSQRQNDTTIDGSNNNLRYEVVEFELESADTTLVADAGSYTWTGSSVDLDLTMPADAGSYTWTGFAVDLDLTMPADAGSYVWTGSAVDLDLTMPADAGSYTWTGQDAALVKSINMVADSGSYVWTGSSVDLDLTMPADAGSYTWTGQDAGLIKSINMPADSASYTWTGQAATLLVDEVIAADSGSYAWTGQDAGLLLDRILPVDSGSYAWTGSAVDLDLTMPADSGSYSWTGQDVGLLLDRILPADSGSYTWTGQDANLVLGNRIGADSGSYTWTGQDATLIPPTPSVTGVNKNIGFINDVGRFMN